MSPIDFCNQSSNLPPPISQAALKSCATRKLDVATLICKSLFQARSCSIYFDNQDSSFSVEKRAIQWTSSTSILLKPRLPLSYLPLCCYSQLRVYSYSLRYFQTSFAFFANSSLSFFYSSISMNYLDLNSLAFFQSCFYRLLIVFRSFLLYQAYVFSFALSFSYNLLTVDSKVAFSPQRSCKFLSSEGIFLLLLFSFSLILLARSPNLLIVELILSIQSDILSS